MKKILLLIPLFLALLAACCKHDDPETLSVDQSYFKADIGYWISYDVEEFTIDNSETLVSSNYILKELFESTFIDNEGNSAFRIERFTLDTATSEWIIRDVWSANLNPQAAHKVEENVKFIKIAFPVKLHKTWDGNAFNDQYQMNYEITSLDDPETVNGINFDSVLTVTQADDVNLFQKRYYIEKFGKNVGLIYKEIIDVEGQNGYNFESDVMKRIEKGMILRQKIIDYGTN